MASQVDIYNRALSQLGAASVSSPSENSRNARACGKAYDIVRQALLMEYSWKFAITRADLPAIGASPVNGQPYAFQLPPDFLKLLPPDNELTVGGHDRLVEGATLTSRSAGPLEIAYVANVTAPGQFDGKFVKALAADLAFEICREITNSTNLQESLRVTKSAAIKEAKRCGAIQRRPQRPRIDSWERSRW